MRMNFSNSAPLLVYTPEEISEIRQASFIGNTFHETDIDNSIMSKMLPIVASYPFEYNNAVLGLISEVTTKSLKRHYDFKLGYRFFVDWHLYPSFSLDDKKLCRNFVEYCTEMLTVLGWNVEIEEEEKESETFFYLQFSPLLSLEPDDVNAAIQKRIDGYAGYAFQIINQQMLENIFEFHLVTLRLDMSVVPMQFYPVVIIRLKELLGPKWTLTPIDSVRFKIKPTTPS